MKAWALASMALGGGCLVSSMETGAPHLRIQAQARAEGRPCTGAAVEVVRGPPPEGTLEVTRGTSDALFGKRAPLEEHEELARQLAARYCADGVSVLRVEERDGHVVSASLVFWRRPTPAP